MSLNALWFYFSLLLINICIYITANSGLFSSVCQINLLRGEEQRLIKGLNRYIQATKTAGGAVPEEVLSLLTKAEGEQQLLDDEFAENPLNAFHILYRMYNDWNQIISRIWCDDCETTPATQDLNITLGIVERKLGGWITEKDLQTSAINILKLYEMYQLEVEDVFDGEIKGYEVPPLSAKELYFIASMADRFDMMGAAVLWFEEFYHRLSEDGFPESTVNLLTVARVLAGVYNKVGLPQKSIELLKNFKHQDQDNRMLKRDLEFYTLRLNGMPLDDRKKSLDLKLGTRRMSKHVQLCRNSLKSTKAESRLKCLLRKSDIPFLYSKEEVFNNKPKISVFHNVLNEDEIRLLQNSTSAASSTRYITYTQRLETSPPINSHTYTMDDIDQSLARKLRKRMNMITRLPIKTKTLLSNGGGQRIVTWNFVLSSAKYGGYLVFTKTKTRVPVVKGSAILWYYQTFNGRLDHNMKPSQCHVLLGSQSVLEDHLDEDGTIATMKCFIQNRS